MTECVSVRHGNIRENRQEQNKPQTGNKCPRECNSVDFSVLIRTRYEVGGGTSQLTLYCIIDMGVTADDHHTNLTFVRDVRDIRESGRSREAIRPELKYFFLFISGRGRDMS